MEHILKTITLAPDTNLVISRPSVDDAAAIIEFLNMVGGETDFLTFGLNGFPLSLAEEQQTIVESLEFNICLMLVGRVNGEIASQLFLQRSKDVPLTSIGDIGISVSKKYWGLSIGRHMIMTAIEWAKTNNLTKLQLQVSSNNERAIGLYKKLGFIIENTVTQDIMKINDTPCDDYIMGLEL
ncbi:MAG: GNAT family N-acetyltransferase [Candidatus Dependentiae bacterium]|nr:GNAT family N-acetyltransferase [Candidatus Dependentiae bacterium]